MHIRLTACLLATLAVAAPAGAQEVAERLTLHASLNAGYGKAAELPVIGIPASGTVDYRIMTLQVRYALSDDDAFVTQLLNRRIGTSPLQTLLGDVTANWAFWQHREGDLVLKAGRTPFVRGLNNEVRYVGTVLPFFRVPFEFTGDAFDALDGVTVSYRQPLAGGWSLQAHALGGGSENRSVRATATELTVRSSRAHNLVGGQLEVQGPIGLRAGAWGNRYDRKAETQSGRRAFYGAFAQVDQGRGLLRAEYHRESGHDPSADIRAGYAEGIARVLPRVHLAGQHSLRQERVFGAPGQGNVDVMAVRSTGAALNVFVQPTTVLKFEHHWRDGYTYDAFVPPTRVEGGRLVANPAVQGNYWIASLAVSF